MALITSRTGLICLIGDPVAHSVSPLIHNKALSFAGLNFIYLAFRVPKRSLEHAVLGLKAVGARGFNVTIPHKTAVTKYLDELDEFAAKIHSVNTVVNDDGTLIGHNTDGIGVINALKRANFSIKGKSVAIIGAGGSGRAASLAIAREGPRELYIINRTFKKALKLAKILEENFHFPITPLHLERASMSSTLKAVDLLINCTSLGMYPNTSIPVHPNLLRRDMLVMDLVYTPLMTPLLKAARDKGARIVNGIEVLVEQAAKSFEIWTGVKAPISLMRRVAYNSIGGASIE
ncbi:MAG TPA: shikimate dehydrogenase [Candidatus Korarchaeota archaeon]|nr:shikimate dehydrogenase [Candidatus Korarchaeota archaeon]